MMVLSSNSRTNQAILYLGVGEATDEAAQTFTIHKDLLTACSPSFRAKISRLLIGFCHGRLPRHELPLTPNRAEGACHVSTDPLAASTAELVMLYSFAHKYDVPQLRQDLMTSFYARFARDSSRIPFPGPEPVNLAVKHLPASSPLCRFWVDLYCLHDPLSGDTTSVPESWRDETDGLFWQLTTARYRELVRCGPNQLPSLTISSYCEG